MSEHALVGQVHPTYLCKLPLVLFHEGGIDLDLRGRKGRGGDELERRVAVHNL